MKYPYSQLHQGKSCVIAIAGPHIKVLNSENGTLLATTDADDAELLKSGPIRYSCIDQEFKHLVTVSEDKKLKVWKLDGLKILSQRELPKKPTQVVLTQNGQTIVVSDKFGDVNSYPFHPTPTDSQDKAARDGQGVASGGALVLGHVSLVTTFILSSDEKYIITADRDEHVRVSWYPQGYNIEMFCLGHEKFVSALHIPPSAPSILISGGGDPVLKIWDWMTGSLKGEIDIREIVEPSLVVKGKKRAWGDDEEAGPGDVRRGTGRKARAKAKQAKKGKQASTDVDMEKDGSAEPEADEALEDDQLFRPRVETEHFVLAVNKIDSIDTQHLVFATYGSTAVFCCKYPPDNPSPKVYSFNFNSPVLDFTVYHSVVWALLDGEWGDSDSQMVRAVLWDAKTAQFAEISSDNRHSALLTSLNTEHLANATAEEVKALELYSNLTSLPKNVDASRDPMKHDIEQKAAEGSSEMTPRELGRLKHKKKLAAKILGADDATGGREVKKVKPDASASGDEVVMDN